MELTYEQYDAMIDEVYPEVKIGACVFLASDILKALDPITYEVGKDDWEGLDND